MIEYKILCSDESYLELIKEGKIHVITFAEEGFSSFCFFLEFAINIDKENRYRLCDMINRNWETGTVYPKLNLTAIPKRFVRESCPLDSPRYDSFCKCVMDCFRVNQEYVKSNHLVFDFRCSASNVNKLNSIIKRVINEGTLVQYIEKIDLIVDPK